MSEYYAVQRSDEYLEHYGIRGMKWGVRKAKERNNMASLSQHYQKAKIKNAKLRERTFRKSEKENAKSYAKGGAALLGIGALGGLASYGMTKGQVALQRALAPNASHTLTMHPVGLYGTSALSTLGGVASLGKATASAYRSTKRGNKKAIEKYKKFRNEMNRQFDKKTTNKVKQFLKQNPEYKFYDKDLDNMTIQSKSTQNGFEKTRRRRKRT